jgi:hypothetical protein
MINMSSCEVVGRDVLVLARLMTLDIHVAWPLKPTSCLPLPLLLGSVTVR